MYPQSEKPIGLANSRANPNHFLRRYMEDVRSTVPFGLHGAIDLVNSKDVSLGRY